MCAACALRRGVCTGGRPAPKSLFFPTAPQVPSTARETRPLSVLPARPTPLLCPASLVRTSGQLPEHTLLLPPVGALPPSRSVTRVPDRLSAHSHWVGGQVLEAPSAQIHLVLRGCISRILKGTTPAFKGQWSTCVDTTYPIHSSWLILITLGRLNARAQVRRSSSPTRQPHPGELQTREWRGQEQSREPGGAGICPHCCLALGTGIQLL